ncbi:MAG: nucleotidyltransferase family protein [Treponemataceae bacterium]
MKSTLLVLAAGMGSRYGGVKQIDAMGPNGETLLDFGTFDAKRAGFEKVIYIIRKDIEKDFRERLFDKVAKNFDADYVFQDPNFIFTDEQKALKNPERTKPWGTIHAVLCAEEQLKNKSFAVINADDYYGRSAFEIMANHFKTRDENSTEHAMIGFVLENTMSKQGSVSRGICITENGFLTKIEENTKIYFDDEGKIKSERPSGIIDFTGNESVSMNFFGFMPSCWDTFHRYWDNFLSKNIGELKAEAYLPEAAGVLVNSGKDTMKVYPSKERWFGMTYPEDKENVKAEIAEKIKSGYYPEKLWD